MRPLSIAACFLLLATACGGDSQSDELAALREQVAALKEQPATEAPATTTEAPATTTEAPATTTEAPATTTEVSAIPADVDLLTEIMVGDSFPLLEGFDILGYQESLTFHFTKLLEGDGSVCTLGGEYGLDVIGKALGTCLVGIRFSVGNSPDLGDVYFRVNVTEASATTEVSAIPADVDLVTEIMVGDSFDIALGALYVLGNSFPDGYSFPSNFLLEGDGSVCTFGGEYDLDVIGKALGTCLLKVTLLDLANGPEGSGEDVYIRINVIVPPPPPPTTTFAPLGDLEWTEARDANREYFDLVQAIETWDLGYTGEGSVVAIVDGGFEVTHPDFTDRIVLEVCVRAEWENKCPNGEVLQEGSGALSTPSEETGSHGTGVAGTVHQFAPDARFILIDVGGTAGSLGETGPAYDWILDNAQRHGIDALVMSYGVSVSQREALITGTDCPDPDGVNEQFVAMKALGVVPIAASGNDGLLESAGGMPGCYEAVSSVGWASRYGLVHTDSNVDEGLTLMAPSGLEVAAAAFEDLGPYFQFAGTSGAAPVVAALIAIGRQINPDATPDELIEVARSTAYSVDDFLVKDLRLVDFLTFSQTLAGVAVSPKKDISIRPDGVINLLVGEGATHSDLCLAGGFTLACWSDEISLRTSPPERISGFVSVCATPSDSWGGNRVIIGVAPGTCLFFVELGTLGDDLLLPPEYFQSRLIQVNVTE